MHRPLLVSVRACGNAMAGRLAEAASFHFTSPCSMSLPLAQISFFTFLSSLAASFSIQSGISGSSFLQIDSATLHLSVAIPVLSLHQINLGYCPGVLLYSLYPKYRQMCQLQPSWELFLFCREHYSLTALEVPQHVWPCVQRAAQ